MLPYTNAVTIEIIALKLLPKFFLAHQIIWFFNQQKLTKEKTEGMH